jgi:hypothetical protein
MAVLTPVSAAVAAVSADAPAATGPACSLQRSGSLWQLGIEAQELTTAIGQLAEQLEADDPEQRASALAELEAALLAEEGNKAALAAKADATCWVIEHLRGQAAYRQQQAKRLSDLARSDAGRADALEESLVFGSINRLVGVSLTPPASRCRRSTARTVALPSAALLPQGQWRSSGANRAGRPCRPASPVAMPPCPPW